MLYNKAQPGVGEGLMRDERLAVRKKQAEISPLETEVDTDL